MKTLFEKIPMELKKEVEKFLYDGEIIGQYDVILANNEIEVHEIFVNTYIKELNEIAQNNGYSSALDNEFFNNHLTDFLKHSEIIKVRNGLFLLER